jgi:hypothetical protein
MVDQEKNIDTTAQPISEGNSEKGDHTHLEHAHTPAVEHKHHGLPHAEHHLDEHVLHNEGAAIGDNDAAPIKWTWKGIIAAISLCMLYVGK